MAQDGLVKSTNLSRKRAMLRLLAELLAAGILNDTAPLLGDPLEADCVNQENMCNMKVQLNIRCSIFAWMSRTISRVVLGTQKSWKALRRRSCSAAAMRRRAAWCC